MCIFLLQELQYVEEEHHRTKITLQGRVKDREDEIQKLRNQVPYVSMRKYDFLHCKDKKHK